MAAVAAAADIAVASPSSALAPAVALQCLDQLQSSLSRLNQRTQLHWPSSPVGVVFAADTAIAVEDIAVVAEATDFALVPAGSSQSFPPSVVQARFSSVVRSPLSAA